MREDDRMSRIRKRGVKDATWKRLGMKCMDNCTSMRLPLVHLSELLREKIGLVWKRQDGGEVLTSMHVTLIIKCG